MIWIGFLRAVNVGQRKYPMAECRAALEAAGFTGVATHIQTGNVRVETPMRSAAKLEGALESVFEADRGFEVPTIAMRPDELAQIARDADDIAARHRDFHGHYVELLREPLDSTGLAAVADWVDGETSFVSRGRALHLLLDKPFHEVRGPTAALKRAYRVSTNRNAKVIRALVDKWC